MAGKGIVARVVRRHCHDGPCAVARQHVVRHPHGNLFPRERIYGIRAGEHARHLAVGDALALRALLRGIEISLHLSALRVRGHATHEFALGGEHHERHAENRVGAGGENRERIFGAVDAELHFRTFGAANPVALRLFNRVAPVHRFQSVEQSLCVSRNAQAPLHRFLLHHGEAAAHRNAVHHLVVGEHRAELRAPVYHCFAEIGDAVVHQHVVLLFLAHGLPLLGGKAEFFAAGGMQARRTLFLKTLHEMANRHGLAALCAVERIEHLAERPLRPMIITRLAGAYLAVPVERKANLVQLFAVAGNILLRGFGGVLSRLNGVLLSGQSVGIVTHRVQHVKTLQAFIAGVNIRSDVTERMSHVQSCARGVGEHIQHVVFRFRLILFNVIGFILGPFAAPFPFDVFVVIFHKSKVKNAVSKSQNGYYHIL